MIWVVLAASAVLAAVAAAAVTWPYRRGDAGRVERSADPLEDERSALLRSLRQLDDERASGLISERDHAALRSETEVRAVAVLRALEARDDERDPASNARVTCTARAGADATALDEAAPNGSRTAPTRRAGAPLAVLIVGVVVALAMVPLLIHAVSQRTAGASITGDTGIAGSTAPGSADLRIGELERRVRDHPNDPAARLDLADAYMRYGRTGLAALQFTEALRLDPPNVAAHTGLAMILFARGRDDDALYMVDRALLVAPNDPEALYARGVILLRGLDRPKDAREAFEAYLAAAPFGSHRAEVQRLLAGTPTSP